MVKDEEKEREDIQTRQLELKIKAENYKHECLEKSFEERELDDEFEANKHDSMDDIDETRDHAKKKITNARNKLKLTIQKMRRKTKTKQQKLSQKLQFIRAKMSKEIMLANKNGNMANCRRGKHDADYREKYCDENYSEDWATNSDCKGEDFCNICCENEFGAMFVTNRDNCYKMCDFKPKRSPNKPKANLTAGSLNPDKITPAKSEEVQTEGKWVWAPRHKAK